MNDLWDSGPVGRILVNVIGALSVMVALYLFYIAYKYLMRLIGGAKVKKVTVAYPELYELRPPYAKGLVQFGFELPERMTVTFQLVDRNNNVLHSLKEGELDEGIYPIDFDTTTLDNGEYFYQLVSPYQKTTKKFFITN